MDAPHTCLLTRWQLERDEIKSQLQEWGISLQQRLVDSLMDACDADHGGSIDYAEFISALAASDQVGELLGARGRALERARRTCQNAPCNPHFTSRPSPAGACSGSR